MSKPLGIVAATGGLLAVAFGAFGSHGLKASVGPHLLDVWQTAVSYQMYHSLALLALALLPAALGPLFRCAAWLMVGGTIIFSGTLYGRVLLDLPALGMVTPLGGVLLLVGWTTLVWAFARHRPN
ncbi:MAG: DUF423 domain-containing protein [Porticoccaceae bacterium]|jgi:uncharacterized membrane protein YgdD (TMEM256/DUF423 family)|nr:DUF423 domain-containing protein [Porticoccaceae bacterium]